MAFQIYGPVFGQLGANAAGTIVPYSSPYGYSMPGAEIPGTVYTPPRSLSDFASDQTPIGSAIEAAIGNVPSSSGDAESYADYIAGMKGKDLQYPFIFSSGSDASSLDYLHADLAKRYGMDRQTAYNEAMANTAYTRAVADMQMAGLNPAVIFGAGRGTPAGSGYAHGVASSGSGYAVSGSGRSYGGSIPNWMYNGALAASAILGGSKGVEATRYVLRAIGSYGN